MPLPSRDIAAVQAFRDLTAAGFERRGLSIAVETKLATWCDRFRHAEPTADFTPSFNPDNVDLAESQFLGGLVWQGTKIIARSGIRFVVTDDLLQDELMSMRLWQTKPVPRERIGCKVGKPDLPAIRGRTCHEGSTWVAASHRRKGIATRLVAMMRAFALLKWQPSWIFGFVQPSVHRSGVAERTYGYRSLTLLEFGYMPVVRRDVTAYISYMTSQEAARLMKTQEKS